MTDEQRWQEQVWAWMITIVPQAEADRIVAQDADQRQVRDMCRARGSKPKKTALAMIAAYPAM